MKIPVVYFIRHVQIDRLVSKRDSTYALDKIRIPDEAEAHWWTDKYETARCWVGERSVRRFLAQCSAPKSYYRSFVVEGTDGSVVRLDRFA